MSRHARVHGVIVGHGRLDEAHPVARQRGGAGHQVVGRQRNVLDALAVMP